MDKPILKLPQVLSAEPRRATDLTDRLEPKPVNCIIEMALPILALPRNEIDELNATFATTERACIRNFPKIDILDPVRQNARKLRLDPTATKSKTDIALPKRAEPRRLTDDPNSMKFITDVLHILPAAMHPYNDALLPKRANVRTLRDELHATKDNMDARLPH
jgi:hypothetical protein